MQNSHFTQEKARYYSVLLVAAQAACSSNIWVTALSDLHPLISHWHSACTESVFGLHKMFFNKSKMMNKAKQHGNAERYPICFNAQGHRSWYRCLMGAALLALVHLFGMQTWVWYSKLIQLYNSWQPKAHVPDKRKNLSLVWNLHHRQMQCSKHQDTWNQLYVLECCFDTSIVDPGIR